jgi:protochlorophyllide reductase
MTGGTSGIGRRAVERLLAEHPQWQVMLLARLSRRTDEVQALDPAGSRLRIIPADLSDLASVERACEDVVAHLAASPIDVMALNAGVQELDGNRASADGYELSFAVNHLAHFAITERLVPRLRRGGRVIITASEVHDPEAFCLVGIARASWQDPMQLADPHMSQAHMPIGLERGEARYSASKLLNVMHARWLAREAPDLRIVSFNPSVVPGTDIARERNWLQRTLWKHVLPRVAPIVPGARTVERSAGDLVWLLTEANFGTISGKYIDGRRPCPGSAESRDWDKIERMAAVSRALLEKRRGATVTAADAVVRAANG